MQINQKVGRWTLLTRSGSNWNCLCECGTQRQVRERSLIEGVSRSCGCATVALHRQVMASAFPKKAEANAILREVAHGVC